MSPNSQSSPRAVRLDTTHLSAAAALLGPRFDEVVLRRELASGDGYCWMGAVHGDGTLVAAHRGLRWGAYLLMKGLFVADAWRDSPCGLLVAQALRAWARDVGYRGIAAWTEPSKPEAALARRLRMTATGPRFHRYRWDTTAPPPATRRTSRTFGILELKRAEGAPLVGDLTGLECDDIRECYWWVLDREVVLLGGNPARSPADTSALMGSLEPVAHQAGATAVELLLEAADVSAALLLASMGARRASRTPVRFGVANFRRTAVLC